MGADKNESSLTSPLNTPPPSQGERSAKVGFHAQDKFSASIILNRLRSRDLLAIRIADPDAGRVDDFQLLTSGRVDAWQVKWATHAGFITLNNLISGDGNKPCLIAQLADGWQRIKAQRTGSRVVVHLATNSRPSKSDKVLPPDPPSGAHLAAFMAECWQPLKLQRIEWDRWPKKWTSWMAALETASGLSPEDFIRFVLDCELDFDCRLENEAPDNRESIERANELDQLTLFLYETGASSERVVELSCDELLMRLGWEDAVFYRNRHEFPVDDRTYQPIQQTERLLQAAIHKTERGYLCLLGTPGSGKSTLLSKTDAQEGERIVRYFSYVPDAQDPGVLRGESVNFLHDLVLALENQGVRPPEGTVRKTDRVLLMQDWRAQLRELHAEWSETKRKTVFIIDGLDHIEREQHPAHSLLHDLLPPDEIPEGVVFVLGTQSDSVLPPRIRHEVSQEGRKVVMESLARADVGQILSADAVGDKLSSDQHDRVFELSAGHPLALAYIVNRLEQLSNDSEVERFLSGAEVFTGKIEETYYQYWRSVVDKDHSVRPVLALISRIRGYIDLDWLDSWEEREAVERFVEASSHLFRRESPSRWYFFHNSFRLFLVHETAKGLDERYSEAKDRKFHTTLADRCHLDSAPQHWKWEELYHRFMGDEHQRVLDLIDQDQIRTQFIELRAHTAIRTDLLLASQCLRFVQDGVAAVRISLLMAEIERRHFTLKTDEIRLIELLIHTGIPEKALPWIRDGNTLLLDESNALYMCELLWEANLQEEARRVFDLVDPRNVAVNPWGIIPGENQLDALTTWYFAARLFRPIYSCLETLSGIRMRTTEASLQGREHASDEKNDQLHLKLIGKILSGCVNRRQWGDFEELSFKMPKSDPVLKRCLILEVEARLDDGEFGVAGQQLEALLQSGSPQSFMGTVRVAESYARLGDRQKALTYFTRIERPSLKSIGDGIPNGFASFEPLFRYDRLAFYCDPGKTWEDLVPDDAQSQGGPRLFQKALCSVAQIWARAWRGEPADALSFQPDITELLRFYHRDFREMEDWSFGYHIKYSQRDLYSMLSKACAAHGNNLIEVLARSYDEVWESGEKRYWPLNLQTEIVVQLAGLGVDIGWAKKWLERFEEEIGWDASADTYVGESGAQAEAWLVVRERDKALSRISQLLGRSFGIGDRKDYQLSTWVRLLGEIAATLPDRGLAAINWIARCIAGLEPAVSGSAVSDAASELIQVCVRHQPDRAFSLFAWFEEKECVWYEEALRSVVRSGLREADCDLKVHSAFVREVLIPISTNASPEIVRRLLGRVFDDQGEAPFRELLRTLVDRINTLASPKVREEWLHGIAKAIADKDLPFSYFNLDQALLRFEGEGIGPEKLILENGQVEYLPDLAARVRSVKEIERLKQLESDNSYFGWGKLMTEIAHFFSKKDILRIAGLFTEDKHISEVCEAVSERLAELGASEEAWLLGVEAAKKSASQSWNRFLDGGPRLSAHLTMLRADPEKGRSVMFEAFAVDGPPSDENIQILLPYLVPPAQQPDLWNELDNHLHALLEGTDQGASGSELEDRENQTDGEPVLLSILIDHLNHPASLLKQTAQKALASLVAADHESTHVALKRRLRADDGMLEATLEIMLTLAISHPDKCAIFKGDLEYALNSKGYLVRSLCLEIAGHCHWADFTPPEETQALPVVYQLELPDILEEDEKIINLYENLIRLISRLTGLPEGNLGHRLTQIVRNLDVNGDLDFNAETRLNSRLRSLGLKMSYYRPRARLAKQGISILLCELATAGKMPFMRYSDLPPILKNFDPFYVITNPDQRPPMIPVRVGERALYSNREDWVNGTIDVADRIPVRDLGGWVVVGSKACFRVTVNSRATERVFSSLQLINSAHGKPSFAGDGLFGQIGVSSIRDYDEYRGDWEDGRLAVESNPSVDSPGAPFLAFHPTLARSIGWQRHSEGILAWVDENEQPVARSCWWQDGPVAIQDLHGEVEIANGWYVVVAPKALVALQQQIGLLSLVVHAQRTVFSNRAPQEGPIRTERKLLDL